MQQHREFLRYGYRLALHCTEKNGFVIGTTSGIAPVGVAEDTEDSPLRQFEQAVFTILPGDREMEAVRHDGEPVKFGSVVRLVHHKQRKAVAYNTKLHSVVDPAHHRVTLETGDGGEKWDKWRIMPRYKVRGEGERVTDGDHIVLQVSSGDKLYLGVSKRKDDAVDGCYEVHAGSMAAGFAVRIYDNDVTSLLSNAGRPLLRAGDCVVMYHKERHSYVSMGSDDRFCLTPIMDKPSAAQSQPVSSRSMFLIEGRDRYRGGIVFTGREHCFRLKDLRTGKYVNCVSDQVGGARPTLSSTAHSHHEGGGQIAFVLSDEEDDASTLYAFHAVGGDHSEKVADRSKVFIECLYFDDDGVWLHEGEPIAQRRVGLRDGFRMEKLHAERSRTNEQRHMLRGIHNLSHSDGFELQRVDDKMLQKLNIILSFLPPISQLARHIGRAVPDYSRVIQVQENLVQLKDMVLARRAGSASGHAANTTSGSARARGLDEASQQQLHDQGVAALCLELAQKILEHEAIDHDLLRSTEPIVPIDQSTASGGGGGERGVLKYSDVYELLQQLFSLVQLIVRGQPAHAISLEEWMEFIVEAIPIVPAALECFIDCVTDNLELVDTNETKISMFFCEQLKQRNRFSGALRALSVLVACGDAGIRQHQEIVAQALLSERSVAERVFVRVAMSSGSVQVAVPNFYFEESVKRADPLALTPSDAHQSLTWVNLGKLEEMATSKHLTRAPHFIDFFVAQMQFFAAVCAGKNARGVAATMGMVSLEAVLPVILADGVPPPIRGAFIRYFTQASLFCEGSLDLREVCKSLHYVVQQPSTLQLETDMSPMFERVKNFAVDNLTDLASCAYQSRPQLLLIADDIVSLCHGLLCRGMFGMDEYPGLVRLLIAIVDSRDDAQKLGLSQSAVKTRSQLAIQFAAQEVQDRLVSVQIAVLGVIDTLFTFLLSKHAMETVDRFCHGQKLPRLSQLVDIDPSSSFLDVAERYHATKTRAFSFFDDAEHDFEVIANVLASCMDAGQHNNHTLRSMAIKLFCRLTNWPRELLGVVQDIQLLTNRSAAHYYRETKSYSDELAKLSRIIISDSVLTTGRQVLDAMESLVASPTGGTQLDKIGMLRHLQVPSSIMAFLRQIPSPPRTDTMANFAIQAIQFLRVMAQDQGVADFLVEELDNVRHLVTADVDMLSLLRFLFVDHHRRVVRLTAPVVNEVVSCLAFPHSAVESILLLQDVVRTKDSFGRYISEVQDLVWRGLCGTYAAHSVLRVKLRWTGRSGRTMRNELLNSAEYYNDMGFLRLHLEMLRLVFYITKFNKLTRSEEVRHELFGTTCVDDLMEVVGNTELPANFRLPYINLLQTLVVQDHSGLLGFVTHRHFEGFLRRCFEDVNKLRGVLGETIDVVAGEPVVMAPHSEFEFDMQRARESPEVYVNLVLMGVVPCLTYVFAEVEKLQTARIADQTLSDIMTSLNSIVDELCELVRFTCVYNNYTDFPEFAACHLGRRKLFKMLRTAEAHGVSGTELWSASIDQIMEAVLPPDEPPVRARGAHEEDQPAPPGLVEEEHSPVSKVADDEGHDLSETQRWVQYYTVHVAKCPALALHNEYASAAGAVIRAGVLGTRFLRHACACVNDLPDGVVVSLFKIVRQVIALTDGSPYDDSALLNPDHMRIAGEAHPNEQCFNMRHTVEERQNVIASWASSVSGKRSSFLPAALQVMATSRNQLLVNTAIRCAIQLTEGGNRNVQKTLNDVLRQRPDEELFIYLRGRFATFRDSVRIYSRLSKAGSGGHLEDIEPTRLMLRLVQLLCEGHFEELQDYMRAQEDNQVSVNVLESLVALLDTLLGSIESRTVSLLQQLLAAIAELIQGPCRGNQEAFIALGIGDSLAALISLSVEDARDLSHEQLNGIHDGAVVVLLSLLEGRTDTPQIASLVSSMSLTLLIQAMDRSHDEYMHNHKDTLAHILVSVDPEEELKDELAVGIQVFIFFKTCLDMQLLYSTAEEFEFVDRDGTTLKQALRESWSYKFMNQRVAMIEVARGVNIERVYFRIPSVSKNNLRDHSKEMLIKRVNRKNDMSRLVDFFERCAKLILELEYYEHLRRTPMLSTVHRYSAVLDIIGFFVAMATNVTLIASIAAPIDLYSREQAKEAEIVTTVLGIIQMILQTILFIHFFFGPMRVHLESKWLRWQDAENEDAAQESRADLSIDPPDISYTRVKELNWPVYLAKSIGWLSHYGMFWQRVLYLVAAFAGFFQSPIWYSVQLLQIVQLSPQLYNVVLSVTTNGTSLLLTFALQIIVIYIFAIIAYYSYSEHFQDEGDNFSCYSLLNCMLVMTNVGLRMGGGIADELPYANYHLPSGAGRFFFDILFFIIVIVIFLNIVFGLIVETFAELREERDFVETDQTTKCFICGINGNEFDRVTAGGFEHHVKTEHNMWHYLFFMHYVQIKPVEDLNGAEHYVREMMRLNEPGFFPIGKALLLEKSAMARKKAEESSKIEDPVAREVATLASQLGVVTQNLQRLQKNVDHLAAVSANMGDTFGGATMSPTTGQNFAASMRQRAGPAVSFGLVNSPSTAHSDPSRPSFD